MAQDAYMTLYLITRLSSPTLHPSLGLSEFPKICQGFRGFPHGTVMSQGSKIMALCDLHHWTHSPQATPSFPLTTVTRASCSHTSTFLW